MKKARKKLQQLEKTTHSFHAHIAKWCDLEAEVKNWITGTTEILCLQKLIIFEARSITDFAGTTS
jgi:hypothetical protein